MSGPTPHEHDWQPVNGRELWCHVCGASISKDELRRQLDAGSRKPEEGRLSSRA